MSKDYYKILGVEKNASQDEIKKAFRKLAHQYHPDKKDGNEQKFKEVNEAYQVLGDESKRAQYDQFGAGFENMGGFGGASGFNWQDFAQQGGGFDFQDLGDIFGDFFGGARRGGPKKQRGADIEVDVTLTFSEAAFGITKDIELYKHTTCSHCKGEGAEPGTTKKTCATCQGAGQVTQVRKTLLGHIQTAVVCDACHGEGVIPEKKCSSCGGAGVTKATEKIQVTIPGGVEHGVTLRVSGKGETAPHGGISGDLYVRIRVKAHPTMERRGSDVLSRIEIPFTLASLGGHIDLETLDGKVSLNIPEGTQSGHTFVLKGKGAQVFQSSHRGNHMVTAQVQVPKKLSRSQKKLLEQLQEEGL